MTLSSHASSRNQTTFYGPRRVQLSPVSLTGTNCLIEPQISLASLTSFRVGGPAQWYVAPRCWQDLQRSYEWAKSQGLSITILGAGSNLLISDNGINGLVISTRHLRSREFDPDSGQMTAGAGEPLARLAWLAAKRGWEGFEWAVGIPGSVGGSVVMNAGAHNQCIADTLVEAIILSPDGTVEKVTPQSLAYSYRTSILQHQDRPVLQATFQLEPGADRSQVMATSKENLNHRKTSQPYHLPSCGSVFRNPTPHAAGWLIEQLGLKGYQIGGAQVAHRHANFILNCGGAKADDIFSLIRYVQEQVDKHWSLLLEPEVRILGEF